MRISMKKSREWLIFNAIHAWLYAYEGVNKELTPLYKELHKEWQEKYEQSNNTETRKRGRPAKRQRTQKASSNSSSTKESKTINQET